MTLMKHFLLYAFLLTSLLCACNGVDRSSEQPLPPTVQTLGAAAEGHKATFNGQVTDSPNSDVLECGFLYGNDTLRVTVKCEAPSTIFTAEADSIDAGTYFAVAYARNGVGTSYGDTIHFEITGE